MTPAMLPGLRLRYYGVSNGIRENTAAFEKALRQVLPSPGPTGEGLGVRAFYGEGARGA
jgi:hypothetical protein